MNNNTVRHQLVIHASVSEVYARLSSPEAIGTWWDKQTLVSTEKGDVMEHNPGEAHGIVQLRIVDQQPNQRIEWECISQHPATSPASAWTGTHSIFELTDAETPASIIERSCADSCPETLTTLDFTQANYDETSEFYGFNNHAWGQVLESLKRACEPNKG